MYKLRSLFFSAPAVVLLTIGMGLVSMFTSIWDKAGTAQHKCAQLWSRIVLKISFVRCQVYGLEKLTRGRSYVLVSNHASYMDTPAILSVIPLDFRFFAKIELFSIPFLGWHLGRAGHLPVVRDDPRAQLKTLSESAKLIQQRGISVLLFPEGGRSEAHIEPFKEGAAYIAIKSGVPIVPIGLINTRGVLPLHTLLVRPGTVELHIGDPIDTAGMKLQDRGKLTELLYDQVRQLAGESIPTAA